MQTNANGISINYQIDGREGAPWLIFSNSLITNLSMWDDQVAGLKDDYRILRYDQRGHGGTQVPRRQVHLRHADRRRGRPHGRALDQARAFLSASPWAA